MAKIKKVSLPSEDQVNKFEMLEDMLDSVTKDVIEFSKKKPNENLNEYKVKLINKILFQIKDFLSGEQTVEFLEILDAETLPTYSDAVLTMGQFLVAMKQFKNKHYGFNEEEDDLAEDGEHNYRWFTKENP